MTMHIFGGDGRYHGSVADLDAAKAVKSTQGTKWSNPRALNDEEHKKVSAVEVPMNPDPNDPKCRVGDFTARADALKGVGIAL